MRIIRGRSTTAAPPFTPTDPATLPHLAGVSGILIDAIRADVEASIAAGAVDGLDAADIRDIANEARSAADMAALLALDPDVPAHLRPALVVAAHRAEWMALQVGVYAAAALGETL